MSKNELRTWHLPQFAQLVQGKKNALAMDLKRVIQGGAHETRQDRGPIHQYEPGRSPDQQGLKIIQACADIQETRHA